VYNSVLTSIAAALLPGGTTWRFNPSDDLRVRNALGNMRRLRSTCYDPINLSTTVVDHARSTPLRL
jgi:hypothetical protein